MDADMFTRSGVHMVQHRVNRGDLNWLFLPGGPGLGSESLHELVAAVQTPGTSWLVDLPGDGSNIDPPGAGEDPYAAWPEVVLEAARAVPNPIFVGHSTGGMYLLSTPALEHLLAGLVLACSAPDCSWQSMMDTHPIPAVDVAKARYDASPGNSTLRELIVATAPWSFAGASLDAGTELLARLPYNHDAVTWSARNFDHVYASTWWPRSLPTLVLSGADDRIIDQSVWNDPRFHGGNVLHRTIPGGQHFPWMENPNAVRAAFAEFIPTIKHEHRP